MSASYDNVAIFRQGITKFRNILKLAVEIYLLRMGELLVRDFSKTKEFQSASGNTDLSFSIGIYSDGVLLGTITQGDLIGLKPLRKKIQKGKRWYFPRPMEGRPRYVLGRVKTSDEYGTDTAKKWLWVQKDAPKKGFCLKAVIGTEYYAYIEPNFASMTNSFGTSKKFWRSIVLDGLKSISKQQ